MASQPCLTGNKGDRVVDLSTGRVWEVYSAGPGAGARPVLEMRGVGFDGDAVVDLDEAREAETFADEGHPLAAEYARNRALDPTGKFLPYFGNHHKRLPTPSSHRGGGVSFGRHLGKPLSEALWEDVTGRLHAERLLVYRDDQCQWTMGWGSGTCVIHLDEAGNVRDLRWSPYWARGFAEKMGDPSKWTYREECGGCVGNLDALAKVDFT